MKARVRKRIAMCLAFSLILSLCLQGRSRCQKQESRIKDQYGKGYFAGGTEKNGYIFGEK